MLRFARVNNLYKYEKLAVRESRSTKSSANVKMQKLGCKISKMHFDNDKLWKNTQSAISSDNEEKVGKYLISINLS